MRPNCACHGEPMVGPGHWQCRRHKQEACRAYYASNRARVRAAQAAYYQLHRDELRDRATTYRGTAAGILAGVRRNAKVRNR